MTTQSYGWLKRVSPELLQRDQIPLIGSPPPFPWQELSRLLAKQLQIQDLVIQPSNAYEWRTADQLTSGLGDQLSILSVEVAPSGGTLHWVMSTPDVAQLMSMLLNPQAAEPPLIEKDLMEGFYHFIALEVINILPHLNFDKTLSAHIKTSELPKAPSLCLNVSLTVRQKIYNGCLVISPELQQNWKNRYAKRTLEVPLSREIELLVHLEAGRVNFLLSEWKQIKAGDFLVLDACSLQANGEGIVTLTVDNIPMYRGKLKDGNIKISEAVNYHEVGSEMSTELPNNQDESPLQNKENNEIESFEEEGEDFDIEENEEGDLDEEDEEEEDEEFLGDFTEIEGLESEPPQEKWPPPPERRPEKAMPEPVKTEVQPSKKAQEKLIEERTFSAEELPLPVVIEVGRLHMSVQQIMELQAGNLLNLDVHPENGVDLVVNGKRIAKGELLLIGDTLGVRIIDIGKSE